MQNVHLLRGSAQFEDRTVALLNLVQHSVYLYL